MLVGDLITVGVYQQRAPVVAWRGCDGAGLCTHKLGAVVPGYERALVLIIPGVLCLGKVTELVPLGFLFFPPFLPPALSPHPPCGAALLALL